MDQVIKIVGFTGSLRNRSYNKAVLWAANEILPERASLEILDLSKLPFFNEDVEAVALPQEVLNFRAALTACDAVFISTPEYNFSLPPVLKNALDWASRGDLLPLSGKPVAIISASPGKFGGARVQYHLRQVCVSLNLIPLNVPEVFIMKANEKFDKNGDLIDEETWTSIKKLLQELVDFARLLKP